MNYRVFVPITGHNKYIVDADNAEDAVKRVVSGDFDTYEPAVTFEDHDTEGWYVEPGG